MVIPIELRKRLGIEEGDFLHAEIDDRGRLVLEPVPRDPIERMRRAAGDLFKGVDAVVYQRALRDEWDA